MKHRLIGETFPVKEVGVESSKEKHIRHGHISTLHLWWARRPLAASRATIYASLVEPPKKIDEWGSKSNTIIKLSKWKNSLNFNIINKIQKEIMECNNGNPPKVLDPFGGGGSIPLEALRLGCETYSGDCNPVAVLIQKCILEFPQKYGNSVSKEGFTEKENENILLKDIKKWSDWVLEKAQNEIGRFYPNEKDNSIPVGYITARTIACQNPKCKAEIPLMRQYWLSKKSNKKIAAFPFVENKKIKFKIVGDGYSPFPKGFDPSKGSIDKAITTCLSCGTVFDAKILKNIFRNKKVFDKQVVVITSKEGTSGKKYRSVTEEDESIFQEAVKYLNKKQEELLKEFGIDPIPYEIIQTPNNKEYFPGEVLYNFTPVMLYGMTKWRDLFNHRQSLSLIVFTEKIRTAHKLMLEQQYDHEYAKAITTYLGIILDRLVDKNSNLVFYNVVGEKIEHVFGRQALQMTWDYVELNPFTSVGWENMQEWVLRAVEHCSNIATPAAGINQESASSLSYKDNFFDAVFTDPPYYDNVPYSVLSDFFYVWLKRSIGHLYPDLFLTPLTPKSDETIADLPLIRGIDKTKAKELVSSIKTKEDFEKMLSNSFLEINRVLKQDGIAVIVYAHKSTEGWETLINSILESGLVITGAWPINTEMSTRLRSQESAALASSIYMVARKWRKEELGFYREVKKDLESHVKAKLEHLWDQGISGADFFISAIGSSIEIFGKYEKIIDDNDQQITTMRLLEDIRKIVTDFAIHQVLHNGFGGEISQMTRLYVLWRWAYGETKVPFDFALKMTQSVGVNIQDEWNKGFIKKDKEFIHVLGPTDRKLEELNSNEMIDVLHKVVILWKNNKRKEMLKALKDSGYENSDVFYKVAQAISDSNPGSAESKLLDGFLSSRMKIMEDIDSSQDKYQTKLL